MSRWAVPGSPRTVPAADATVQVEFPFARRGMALTASVVEWRPPADGVATDIAVLELDREVTERPYRTIAGLPHRGQAFWTKGFPEGQDGGMDAAGELGTPIEHGRLLAHGSALPGFFIEGGFSGAPLLDEATNAVIGMAAAATRDPSQAHGVHHPGGSARTGMAAAGTALQGPEHLPRGGPPVLLRPRSVRR